MCVHLQKNDFRNQIGDLISSNIFSLYPRLIVSTIRASSHWKRLAGGKLLGRTLRPQNLIEGGYLRWKIEKEM